MKKNNKEIYLIDDTYGFDGVRIYKDFCPTLRSSRSGLKIAELIMEESEIEESECKNE
jgi:DNA (cytosine-5)-methyltransferase 1